MKFYILQLSGKPYSIAILKPLQNHYYRVIDKVLRGH